MSRILSRIKLKITKCFTGKTLEIANKALEKRDFNLLKELVEDEIEQVSKVARTLNAELEQIDSCSISDEELSQVLEKELKGTQKLKKNTDKLEMLFDLETDLMEYTSFEL